MGEDGELLHDECENDETAQGKKVQTGTHLLTMVVVPQKSMYILIRRFSLRKVSFGENALEPLMLGVDLLIVALTMKAFCTRWGSSWQCTVDDECANADSLCL